MRVFEDLGRKKVVLGMVHLGALPGTPFYADGSYEAVRDKAVRDARALQAGGADGCVVQNAGDRVFAIDHADPVVIVAMTDIVRAVADAGPRVLDMHAKDLRDLSAVESQCIVGEGKIPIAAIFRQLEAIRYGGFVNLEYEIDADNPMPGMKQSFAYMRGVLAGLG